MAWNRLLPGLSVFLNFIGSKITAVNFDSCFHSDFLWSSAPLVTKY